MATINLGRVKPVFRGAYNSSTAYVVDDIVTSSDETFICIQASTGNATSNATYWTKLAAKGTDGTDVGTTLTTQGDILYRDGSGLQRLAAGTSGQILQTGGSGANPSWIDNSGGLIQTANAFKIDKQSFNYNSGRVVVSGLNVTLPNAVDSNSKLFITGHLTLGGQQDGDPGVAPRWEYSTDNSSWSVIQNTTWITSGHAGSDANVNVGNSAGYDGWQNNEDVKHASWSTMCSASDVSQARYYRVTVRQTDSSNHSVVVNSNYGGTASTGYAPSGNSSLVVMEIGV